MTITKNHYLILAVPFFIMAIIEFFIPHTPIWDERFFYPVVQTFGESWIPSLQTVKEMNSPMGPIFFILWGFIGKLVGFNLLVMRLIHLIVSYGLILLCFNLFKPYLKWPLLGCILFVLNPYFCTMTAPLLYTDITGLLFVLLGAHTYFYRQNRWLVALWMGLAICTRQLFIIFPLAIFINDLLHWKSENLSWKSLLAHALPVLMFLPLFFLWDYNVNSNAFSQTKQFEENTLKAFSFSFKKLNYAIMLIGIYAMPFIASWKPSALNWRTLLPALFGLALLPLGFPNFVNRGLAYGSLPDTAGLLDIALTKVSILSYVVTPALMMFGIWAMWSLFKKSQSLVSSYCKIVIALFIILVSIYSYCWDKHFMAIMPFVFILACLTPVDDSNKLEMT